MDIMNFIVKSHAAKDDDVLFNLLKDFVNPLGFDKLIFCLMTDHPSIGELAMHGKITGYPEDWMKYYVASGYETTDPIRKESVLETQRLFTWDGIDKIRPFDKNERLVMNQANDAGLKNGVAVSLRNKHNEVVALGFASSRGGIELEPTILSALKVISIQFYDMYQLLKSNQTTEAQKKRISLTPREKEVLTWAAAGKSIPDIASILKLTDRCVAFHLNNSYAKLDANCKTLAAVKAMRLSLIKLDDDLDLSSKEKSKTLVY